MSTAWSTEALARFAGADELEIAVRRADDTLHSWTPIWVVVASEHVYVRTWYRRDSGWFGRALRTRRARVRVPGLEADVVEDVGATAGALRDDVDAAYRAEYGSRYGSGAVDRMVGDDAAAATLRLDPAPR